MTYTSSCHCGALSASIDDDMPTEAMSCNCSMCRRKGHLLHFVPASAAAIDASAGKLSDYTFNKHAIHHHFCATCGCNPFGKGTDRDGNEMVAINMRCVTDCDLDSLQIHRVDGASF